MAQRALRAWALRSYYMDLIRAAIVIQTKYRCVQIAHLLVLMQRELDMAAMVCSLFHFALVIAKSRLLRGRCVS